MSLLDEMSDVFVLMERHRTPDGEGGFTTTYTETTIKFLLAITHDTTIQARTAEQEGMTSTYTLYPPKNVQLEYHDVLKRLVDGAIFRITSQTGEKKTPDSSNLNLGYVTAERWVSPK